MTAVSEIKRRMNAALDDQRERLHGLHDSMLVALDDHIRALYSNAEFDSTGFLCRWIFLPIPALNGLSPAEAIALDGGLARVKQLLGQQAVGTFV